MFKYDAERYLEHMKRHHRSANIRRGLVILVGVAATIQGHPLGTLLALGVMELISVGTELSLLRGLLENARDD